MFPSYFANYVCSVWLNAHKASPPKFLPSECGWVVQDDCYRLKWYDGEASPTTVEDICHDDSENDIWVEGMTSQGDGCSRWSVAGGDDGVLLMVARKTVPTVAVC